MKRKCPECHEKELELIPNPNRIKINDDKSYLEYTYKCNHCGDYFSKELIENGR